MRLVLSLLSLLICLSICVQAAAGAGKRALVIGNSSYLRLPAAPESVKNAEALASALVEIGFKSTVKYELEEKEMRDVIAGFVQTVQAGDIVLFYYSGHAVQVNDLNRLLPIDFKPQANLSNQGYPLGDLQDGLDDKSAGTRILVLDASRNLDALRAKISRPGLADVTPGTNTLISFSAYPGQVVKGASAPSVGIYTGALIKALKTPGLRPVEAFNRVQTEVSTVSEGRQSPYVQSAAVSDFFFVAPPLPEVKEVRVFEDTLKPGMSRENSKDRLPYVWIPAGKFKMGCVSSDGECAKDEKPQHEVSISKPFWMTRTEVTAEAFRRFADAASRRMPDPTVSNPKWKYGANPVTKVSWQDATDYCAWAGGQLPSEAEWEYAARGGKDDEVYPWGNSFESEKVNSMHTNLKKKEPFTETVPVDRFPPNGFDLYNMPGNVREWTRDKYRTDAYSGSGPFVDPVQNDGNEYVVRGGSFAGGSKQLRTSAREKHPVKPQFDNQTGFRCVVGALPKS